MTNTSSVERSGLAAGVAPDGPSRYLFLGISTIVFAASVALAAGMFPVARAAGIG